MGCRYGRPLRSCLLNMMSVFPQYVDTFLPNQVEVMLLWPISPDIITDSLALSRTHIFESRSLSLCRGDYGCFFNPRVS